APGPSISPTTSRGSRPARSTAASSATATGPPDRSTTGPTRSNVGLADRVPHVSRRYQVLAALILAIAACSSDPQSSAVTGIGSASAQTKGAITVFAAASLTEAFGAAGTALHAAQPRVEVTFDFAASGTLVAQLEQGAPADVVATADRTTMQ